MDELLAIVEDSNYCGVSIDSRQISEGECFFAIRGDNFDGHDFVTQAFEKGACCAVVEKGFQAGSSNGRIIEVDNTCKALGILAAHYRKLIKAKVIAITGSVGKTSTRDMIAQVLSTKYKCSSAKKSFNNHIGLPLTILQTPQDCQMLVLELGTNHPGEIEYLSKIAMPDIAVITKVAAVHLEFFHSIENIAAEKASIVKGISSNGLLIANADSKVLVEYLEKKQIPFIGYSALGKTSLNDRYGTLNVDGSVVKIPLAGMGSLENALAAYTVCLRLGITAEEFKNAAANFKPSDMRLNILEFPKHKVINDCYNASPLSMSNAIEVLCRQRDSKRKVFICGDMKELGKDSSLYHKQLGRLAADSGVDVIAAVGEYADLVVEAARLENQNIEAFAFENTSILCSNLHKILKPNDTILIKGSRAIGLEKCVDAIKLL